MFFRKKPHIFFHKGYQIHQHKKKRVDTNYYYKDNKLVKIRKVYKFNKYFMSLKKIEEYDPDMNLVECIYFNTGQRIKAHFKNGIYKKIMYRDRDISDFVNGVLFNGDELKGHLYGNSFEYKFLAANVVSLPDSKIDFKVDRISFFCDGFKVDKVKIIKIYDEDQNEYENIFMNDQWYNIGEVYFSHTGIFNISTNYHMQQEPLSD